MSSFISICCDSVPTFSTAYHLQQVQSPRLLVNDRFDEEERGLDASHTHSEPQGEYSFHCELESLLFGSPALTRAGETCIHRAHVVFLLWETYIERVVPVVKLLHKPTIQAQLVTAIGNTNNIPSSLELLLFAIYFASITSMTAEEYRANLKGDRVELLKRFRSSTESALLRAGLLNTKGLRVLRAFTPFLVCIAYETLISDISVITNWTDLHPKERWWGSCVGTYQPFNPHCSDDGRSP